MGEKKVDLEDDASIEDEGLELDRDSRTGRP